LDLSAPASAAKIGIIIAITAIAGPMIEAIGSAVDQTAYRRPPRRKLTPGVGFGREGRRDDPATLSRCVGARPATPKMRSVSPIATSAAAMRGTAAPTEKLTADAIPAWFGRAFRVSANPEFVASVSFECVTGHQLDRDLFRQRRL
jgi:hypothetical protein